MVADFEGAAHVAQELPAIVRELDVHEALAAPPFVGDRAGIQDTEAPREIGTGEVGSGANAHITAAVAHILPHVAAPRLPDRLGLRTAGATGKDDEVERPQIDRRPLAGLHARHGRQREELDPGGHVRDAVVGRPFAREDGDLQRLRFFGRGDDRLEAIDVRRNHERRGLRLGPGFDRGRLTFKQAGGAKHKHREEEAAEGRDFHAGRFSGR